MPAPSNLAALMKEWPPNSVTLISATYSKLRKAVDGTGTQIATCMINRWTVKMNGAGGYITTEISQGRTVRRTAESPGREASENWEEEEFILGLSPRTDFYLSSTPLIIPLPNVPTRPLMKSSLRPSSWAYFFTKFIVLGLLGLDSLTSIVKGPSNLDPTKRNTQQIKANGSYSIAFFTPRNDVLPLLLLLIFGFVYWVSNKNVFFFFFLGAKTIK